jgi:rhodanese-related sulfurtransferase
MGIEDNPDFPRFNMVSTGLRDAEARLLQALKSGNKSEIVAAKLVLMGTLDEYSKVVGGIGKDMP